MKLRCKINDQFWQIKVVTSKTMKKQREDGDDIAGLCVTSEKTILIHEEYINYEVICHELFHAYFSDLHLDDTNEVSLVDLEEIYASFFTAKAQVILDKARKITKELQKKGRR